MGGRKKAKRSAEQPNFDPDSQGDRIPELPVPDRQDGLMVLCLRVTLTGGEGSEGVELPGTPAEEALSGQAVAGKGGPAQAFSSPKKHAKNFAQRVLLFVQASIR